VRKMDLSPRNQRVLVALVLLAAVVICGLAALTLPNIRNLITTITPTATPIPAPNIVGYWSGCIQGHNGLNEGISLTINSESKTGTLDGFYGEDYYLYTLVYNETIQGNWSISNAGISTGGQLQFLTHPVKNVTYLLPGTGVSGPVSLTYLFTGKLSPGELSGTVIENNDGISRDWVLFNNTGNTCPW